MWTALEGVLVGSRYEMQAHLATGGMAAVFRAWDHRLCRPVAIKVLRQFDEADEHAIERFRREAQAAAMLQSPHIVEVYDFFEEDECHYLVMELVEGVNLKEHVAEQGPVPPESALGIAAQVCDALAAAHDAGFIHRDIKPQNILLGADGSVKLADFGIVHIPRAQRFTTGGMVLGTADYISPEQAQGLELTPTTDIYSLGVVLYEMLTGALPFTGTTPIAVAMRHASAPVPPLRQINPSVPRAVERIVLCALRKEPVARFSSARAMAAALRQTRTALLSLCETNTSGGQVAVAPAGSSEHFSAWQALARRLSQPLPALSTTAGDLADDDPAGARLPDQAPLAMWAGDAEEESAYSDFAEYYAPSGDAGMRAYAAARRLATALCVAALLLVGIVVLHLVR
jgi:serine/threonine protein kinase